MFGPALMFAASAMTVPINAGNVATYLVRSVPAPARSDSPVGVAATINLWVEPNGRIARCSLGRFVGNETTASLFCGKMLGMRFGSPRDEQRRKTYAYVPLTISFSTSSRLDDNEAIGERLQTLPNRTYPDSDLPFSGAPSVGEDRYGLILSIGTDGKVRACAKSWDKVPDEVVESACELAKERTYTMARSDDQEAVSYLRYVTLVPQG